MTTASWPAPGTSLPQRSPLSDFDVRGGLVGSTLVQLFAWDEATFLRCTEGSPIRRIGHERWLRNIAVALGNALRAARWRRTEQHAIRSALQAPQAAHDSSVVREHVPWALAQGNA